MKLFFKDIYATQTWAKEICHMQINLYHKIIVIVIGIGAIGTIKKGTENTTRNVLEAMNIKSHKETYLPGNGRIIRRVLSI